MQPFGLLRAYLYSLSFCVMICLLCLFMPSSMCLHASHHVYVLRPRPCLSCHVLLQPTCSFYRIFLCFGLMVWTRSRPYGLCHRPYTKAHIKGFRSSYLHVYACFYALCLCSLVLGFATLDTLYGLNLVWLHPTPMRPCLDVTILEASPDAGLLHIYPSLSAACDAYHICSCHPLAFYASLHACSYVHT